jgi:aryl-alcohol dehydrogenase-like predicted oxidoreductase
VEYTNLGRRGLRVSRLCLGTMNFEWRTTEPDSSTIMDRAADVALAWLLSRPGVTAPIIGPSTADQVTAAVRALAVTLDGSVLARLDELFPPVGTGGPGPEAWAW